MGIATTLAMFLHEIPHEVGDFAILFQLNFSIFKIVGLQLLTAVGALVGTYIGGAVGQIYVKESIAFTSGGFLYFALNGLFNELKEVRNPFTMVMCLCSMVMGLYFMFVFALYE